MAENKELKLTNMSLGHLVKLKKTLADLYKIAPSNEVYGWQTNVNLLIKEVESKL